MTTNVRGHCSRVKGLLNAYVDRELGYTDHLLVSRHVATCPDCAFELERYKNVKRCLTELPQPDCDHVIVDLRHRFAREKRQFIRQAVAVGVFAAASAVFAALFVSGFTPSHHKVDPIDESRVETASDRVYSGGLDDFGAPSQQLPASFAQH